MIISSHINTLLNYRMAVPFRSDFLAYKKFPEVYHGEGITTPPFSGVQRPGARNRGEHNMQCVIRMEKRDVPQDMACGGRREPVLLKKIRNRQKSDLRGGKPVKDMIIKRRG